MGDHSAFFYGTLMEPRILRRVCYGTSTPMAFQASLLTIRPAILHNHCRHKVLHHDYPAQIPQANSSVRGSYVQGLTDGDIFRLDIFEGDEYERRKVKIRILDVEGNEAGEGNVEGEEFETETYIWVAGRDKLEDGEWDFGEFRREKMQHWIGGRDEYDEVDEAVRARESDPTGGRGMNGSITEKLEGKKGEKVLESAV
ncbi:MAG: hypothetical protein Q9213_004797 [Squamulea squamosa]